MPTNRVRRRPERRQSERSPRVLHMLVDGYDWTFLGGPGLTEDLLAAAWEQFGQELLHGHVFGFAPDVLTFRSREGRPGKPGTRPFGWWLFEAPELRRVIAGEEDLDLTDKFQKSQEPLYRWTNWFGQPHSIYVPGCVYESQQAYLARLGLFLPGEERPLKAA